MASPTTAEKLLSQFPDLVYTKLPSAEENPLFLFKGFKPGLTILPKGHVLSEGCRAFGVPTAFDRDVAIQMRDSIKIYADIFRPADSDLVKVPAIIPWSPYGKTSPGPQQYNKMAPFNAGLPRDRTSGYEKFEAPDPAEWCERGYAIVNVDARGAGMSEGNISFWGQQEAEDIYDTIDWLSKQPWCNGSVAMAGNSWLSIAQINFASRLSHPALKALAPWESLNDPYRDSTARGGMPHNRAFQQLVMMGFAGPNYAENLGEMLEKRPLYDSYWESKLIKPERIGEIPLYLLASYSSGLHTKGSFHTFRTAKSSRKWLRVHPYQEWYDLYRPEITDELQRYFDRYCKGIENGWEHDTPPVRLSLLGFDGSAAETVIERPEQEYPLARQKPQLHYLDASIGKLVPELPARESTVSHLGHDLHASSDFSLYFGERTEIAGYAKVRLWMSCAEKDDMDVVVQIRKISRTGELLTQLNYPIPVPHFEAPNCNVLKALGPQGFLRASHAISRETPESVDPLETEIFYKHDRAEPIAPGTIVPLDISLWPMGMVFAPGEGIMLRVAGHDMNHPEAVMLALTEPVDANIGTHVIYTGAQYDSHLIIPVIPNI